MKLKFNLKIYGCSAVFGCSQCLSLRLASTKPWKWHCGISKIEIPDIHKSREYKQL